MIREVDHIGIAVRSVEEACAFYRDVLALRVGETFDMPGRGVRAAMVDGGNVTIELLEPLGEDTPVGKFLDKHGEGIHHIAFRVANIDAAMEKLKDRGVEFVTPQPKIGAHGRRIAFLSPRSCHGVLIELCEAVET